MFDRFRTDPEPDAVYIELVNALFHIEGPTWIAGLLFTGLGAYLALMLGDPVTAALTATNVALMIPRLTLLRLFRRARQRRGGTLPDVATAATWENRYTMGLILFAALVGALQLRMLAVADATYQMLTLTFLFGFATGTIARVSVRPLTCLLALSVATCPTVLAAWLAAEPRHTAFAVVLLSFLAAAFGTVRHCYAAARAQITVAHEMAAVARNDPLTGLLNRFGLRQAFARIAPAPGAPMLAVHYCDLDGFKPVNDRHGHPAGDAVLAQVAARLRGALRVTDIAARIGGDEFVVVQAPVRHGDEVAAFAAELRACLAAPYAVTTGQVSVGASIGSALATAPRPDLDRLLGEADRALYAVKQARGRTAA